MKFNRKRMIATVLTVCLLLCEANIFAYAKEQKTIGLAASATGQGPEETKQNGEVSYEKEFSEEGLLEFLKDKVAYYKLPEYVLVFDELPMNASGKILLSELKAQAVPRVDEIRRERG